MTRPPASDAPRSGGEEAWDRAIREAVDWTIYLDDDPDDADLRARFKLWQQRDPMHVRAWAEASHASGLIAQTRKVALFPVAARQSRPVESERSAKRRFRPVRKTVVAGAIAAAIAWFAAPQIFLQLRADHITGAHQQDTVTLDDGSTVRLAPGSAVKVAYSTGSRSVELLAGEAYFEVKRNPTRPFRVLSDSAAVTVLGTGFDVRRGDNGTDVAVKHGRVRVASSPERGNAMVLTAGQWAHMALDGRISRGRSSPQLVGAWSDRRITAVDKPLSEVLTDLRRYHRGAIILTDSRLGRSSVTGTFDAEDAFKAASLIVQPHGGTVRQITPWLIVISGP